MTEATFPDATQDATQDEMCCPTCRARQAWSDECRRCKSDLSLLRRYWRAREAERLGCLRELRAGHPDRALRHAHRYAALAGTDKAWRLVAVCSAFGGDWRTARMAVAKGDIGAAPQQPRAQSSHPSSQA